MKKLLAIVAMVGFVFAGEPKILIKFPLKVGLTTPVPSRIRNSKVGRKVLQRCHQR